MQIDLGTIRKHVGEKLHRIDKLDGEAERLEALRKFLKIETQRLHLRHRVGGGGSQIAEARSLIVDMTIGQIAREVVEVKGREGAADGRFAIVALGGYGRRELSPYSDIDILFLYQGRKDASLAAELSEAVLYKLWDAGFEVGHSVRSLSECTTIAREDIVSRNSMIDARLVWGSAETLETLEERLEEEIFEKQKRQLLDELMVERLMRHNKFGEAACLQEPNVKESAGGLRDLHVLLWASRIAYGSRNLFDLVQRGILSHSDAERIGNAYDFLLRVRNELHFMTGRRTDFLSFDLQGQVAASQGYTDSPEQQASELFMHDYYMQARRLYRLCDSQLQRALSMHEKKRWFSRSRVEPAAGGFIMQDGVLDLDSGEADFKPELDGRQMMLAFSYAQATGATLSSNLQDAIVGSLDSIDGDFRSSPAGAQAFMKVLGVRGRVAAGLRQMHDLNFLGRFLPEFGRITCLVQHDLYHRYTVDEHTLRTLGALDDLAGSRSRTLERYRELYNEIKEPAILHLGLLMHDIGKGLGGGHTGKGMKIAEGVCDRLQIAEHAKEQVIFLIREHLTMSRISQRRDLSDKKVIRDFASQMGSMENLNMLTLLTYADINGVGPEIWNEWKDALLWELYQRARMILHPDEESDRDSEQLRRRISRMVANEIDYEEVAKHFKLLPRDYARFTNAQTIIEHLRLANTLMSRTVRTSWRVNPQARCTDMHLCAPNRRGLFAAVAGALTAQGINILSVSLNTRSDGLAVDSFKVQDTAGEPISDPARWEQIDHYIQQALNGEVDIEEAVQKRLRGQRSSKLRKRRMPGPAEAVISWDNESSDKSTILEVKTADRLGLAYRIASTLTALDLDIGFAKVATEKNLALDIFYISTAEGLKPVDVDLPEIETAIRGALREHVAA